MFSVSSPRRWDSQSRPSQTTSQEGLVRISFCWKVGYGRRPGLDRSPLLFSVVAMIGSMRQSFFRLKGHRNLRGEEMSMNRNDTTNALAETPGNDSSRRAAIYARDSSRRDFRILSRTKSASVGTGLRALKVPTIACRRGANRLALAVRPGGGQRDLSALRPAGDAEIHDPGSGGAGLLGRRCACEFRDADEVSHRHVRAVQYRQPIPLHRKACIQPGGSGEVAG
jgi:hypothetical protein